MQWITDLTCKYRAEHGLGDITKKQTLLRARKSSHDLPHSEET